MSETKQHPIPASLFEFTKSLGSFFYRYPAISYFLLVIVVFWPLSLGIYALQYDAVDVFLPWRFFASEALIQGDVPLWNPYADGGYPMYADHQFPIWNPELFIVSLFGRYNASTIQWLYLIYVTLGGLGFRFLLKNFNLNENITFIGGILFMFSGVIIGDGQAINWTLGSIWLPWALGAYINLFRTSFTGKSIVTAIICIYLMLSSGYQAISIMLFYLFVGIATYQLIVLIRSKEKKTIVRFFTGHLLLATGVGILLIGTLVSLIEVYPYLNRLSGFTLENTQKSIFHPTALLSLVYPMATVKMDIYKMSVSTQNIFMGVISLFFLGLGIRHYKRFHSPYLAIILITGCIYGLASMGPFTPVQPFLAQYLPGFDLFFYPIFYRVFTWLAALILICFGLHYFSEMNQRKWFTWFISGAALLFIASLVYTSSSFGSLSEKWTSNWAACFREFSVKESVLLQSGIHLLILGSFLTTYTLLKKKHYVIHAFIIIELIVIAQLNIPITTHGETRTKTLNHYLSQHKIGFPTPNLTVPIQQNDAHGKFASIWRNQTNYTNQPGLMAWTSFHLANREITYQEHPELTEHISALPFAYLASGKGTVKVNSFSPNSFEFQVNSVVENDTLIVQQADFPGWEVTINGTKTKPERINVFEQAIPVFKATQTVSMKFEHYWMKVLFYFTHLGFILLLLSLIVMQQWNRWVIGTTVLLILGFVSMRLVHYQQTVPKESKSVIRSATETISSTTTPYSSVELQDIYTTLSFLPSKTIELEETIIDLNPELISLMVYDRPEVTIHTMDQTSTSLQFEKGDGTPYYDSGIEIIELNETSPYFEFDFSALNHSDHLQLLCFGSELNDQLEDQQVLLAMEVHAHGKKNFYRTSELQSYTTRSGKDTGITGMLLPNLGENEVLKVYLWNTSSKDVQLSNLKIHVIEFP